MSSAARRRRARPFESYGVVVDGMDALPGLMARLRGMQDAEVEALRTAARRFCLTRLVNVHTQADSMVEAVLSQMT